MVYLTIYWIPKPANKCINIVIFTKSAMAHNKLYVFHPLQSMEQDGVNHAYDFRTNIVWDLQNKLPEYEFVFDYLWYINMGLDNGLPPNERPTRTHFSWTYTIVTVLRRVNTLRPRQNGRHFADDMFKCIFVNENVWIPIEISLKFVPKGSITNIPAFVQIMAWRRLGDKPLSEPMMVSSQTHICVTRPQWVKWQQ